ALRSGGYVGNQTFFQNGNLVLQEKLLFLEAPQLEVVLNRTVGEVGDHLVETAMHGVQFGEFGARRFQGFFDQHAASSRKTLRNDETRCATMVEDGRKNINRGAAASKADANRLQHPWPSN